MTGAIRMASVLIILGGCATSPQVSQIALGKCAVTWNQAALPERVDQWCTEQDAVPALDNEISHAADIRGETIAGQAEVFHLYDPVPSEGLLEELKQGIDTARAESEALRGDILYRGPKRAVLAPWGEQVNIREFTFSHIEEAHLCVAWDVFDSGPEGFSGGRFGYACASDDPYAILEAVEYKPLH